jgi:hypothetical protein
MEFYRIPLSDTRYKRCTITDTHTHTHTYTHTTSLLCDLFYLILNWMCRVINRQYPTNLWWESEKSGPQVGCGVAISTTCFSCASPLPLKLLLWGSNEITALVLRTGALCADCNINTQTSPRSPPKSWEPLRTLDGKSHNNCPHIVYLLIYFSDYLATIYCDVLPKSRNMEMRIYGHR